MSFCSELKFLVVSFAFSAIIISVIALSLRSYSLFIAASFESSSALDYDVKMNVATDLLNVLQIPLFERPASVFLAAGCDPPVAAAGRRPGAGIVNLVRTAVAPPLAAVGSAEDCADVVARVADEATYAGGFRRVWPTPAALVDLRHCVAPDSVTGRADALWSQL